MTIKATQYDTAREAIAEMEAQGHNAAILLGHDYLTCTDNECRRIAEAGVDFAYLAMTRDGQILTIPTA
jgi:hypothetical protein